MFCTEQNYCCTLLYSVRTVQPIILISDRHSQTKMAVGSRTEPELSIYFLTEPPLGYKESSVWHSVVAILLDCVTIIAPHSILSLHGCQVSLNWLGQNEISQRKDPQIAIQEESPWSFWSWEIEFFHRDCFFLGVCCHISGGALLQGGRESKQ